jgi:hypothetical protein
VPPPPPSAPEGPPVDSRASVRDRARAAGWGGACPPGFAPPAVGRGGRGPAAPGPTPSPAPSPSPSPSSSPLKKLPGGAPPPPLATGVEGWELSGDTVVLGDGVADPDRDASRASRERRRADPAPAAVVLAGPGVAPPPLAPLPPLAPPRALLSALAGRDAAAAAVASSSALMATTREREWNTVSATPPGAPAPGSEGPPPGRPKGSGATAVRVRADPAGTRTPVGGRGGVLGWGGADGPPVAPAPAPTPAGPADPAPRGPGPGAEAGGPLVPLLPDGGGEGAPGAGGEGAAGAGAAPDAPGPPDRLRAATAARASATLGTPPPPPAGGGGGARGCPSAASWATVLCVSS